MTSPRFVYWALVAAALALAAIGVVTVAWGVRTYAQIASAYAVRLVLWGLVLAVAGGLGARWLLERRQ